MTFLDLPRSGDEREKIATLRNKNKNGANNKHCLIHNINLSYYIIKNMNL